MFQRQSRLTSQEVNEALLETIASIVDVVRVALENTPPELSSDLVDKGITLAGGGSLLRGIDRLLSRVTGLPVLLQKIHYFVWLKVLARCLKILIYLKKH